MVVKTNLLADSLYFIKNDISTSVTDPISSTRPSKSNFVLTSYPTRPVTYPIITIKALNIEAFRAGMQTTSQDILITLEVRIWARNEKEKDDLYTDILNRLANVQFVTSGSVDNAIHDFTVLSSVEVDEVGEPGGQVIKSRIMQIQYKFFG